MTTHFDVIIIGGGLAGCSAGMLLGRKGLKVLIIEKNGLPAHKVCGEFLSPGIWPQLDSLGLREKILAQKGSSIEEAVFYFPRSKELSFQLPRFQGLTGYGLSRKKLDWIFFNQARENGCRALDNCEAQKISQNRSGFTVEAFDRKQNSSHVYYASQVFNAAGKLNQWKETPQKSENKTKIGFKAHFKNLKRSNKIRLYFFKGGYLGTAPIEDGLTNLCGLVDSNTLKQANGSFDLLLNETGRENAALKDFLREASPAMPWMSCPVHEGFQSSKRTAPLSLGDAACFLEPFMGQGMTYAVASGFLLSHLFSSKAADFQALKQLYQSKSLFGASMENFLFWISRHSTLISLIQPARLLLQPIINRTCAAPKSPPGPQL